MDTAKIAILSKLCNNISTTKQANNDKISYGFMARQVKTMGLVWPWITRDAIMNAYRKHEKRTK